MRTRLLAGALLLALAITAAAVAGTGPKITEKVLGAAGVAQPYSVNVTQPADVIVARARIPAGASFGWHSHRSAVVAIVKSGELTLYDGDDTSCTPQRFHAGQGFTEPPDHVHLARNEGTKPVVVLVTYLGAPHGQNPDVPAADPGHCSF